MNTPPFKCRCGSTHKSHLNCILCSRGPVCLLCGYCKACRRPTMRAQTIAAHKKRLAEIANCKPKDAPCVDCEISRLERLITGINDAMKGPLSRGERMYLHLTRKDFRAELAKLKESQP